MDIVFGDVEKNIENAKKKISEAMKERPDVIVLPELWTTGYDLTRLSEIADNRMDKKQRKVERMVEAIWCTYCWWFHSKANRARGYKYNVCCKQ